MNKPRRKYKSYHSPGWTPAQANTSDLRLDTHAKVQELSDRLNLSQIDVLTQAVDQMIENLPPEQRKLFEALPD